MPLPVVHSFAGYSIYKLSLPASRAKNWKMAGLMMTLANLPDLDYIPGMIMGAPELFHRNVTHSLGFAVGVSLTVAGIAKLWKKLPFVKMFLISSSAYFSHLLLDYITGSVKFMFWPFRITMEPMPITELFNHAHHLPDCGSLQKFCSLLVSQTLTLRLFAEIILVFVITKTVRLFSKSKSAQPGISESPAFLYGLAIFIIVLTTFAVKDIAG